MKVKYRLYAFGKLPMLNVILKNGSDIYPLSGLVDSGAGESIFSEDIAKALGIDLKNCPEREYDGIGGATFKGHTCAIELKIPKFDKWITIDAGFLPNQFPVIGHSGFFDNYEVIFRSYQDTFEVKSKPGRKTPRPRPKRSGN